MDDLSKNVYHPTEGAFQRNAGSAPEQGFGRFDFGRAMSLGMDSYKEYVGLGAGTTIVWFFVFIIVYILCIVLVGFFLLPVIAIGPTLLGYYMVRRQAEFGHLFKGFEAYGRVLGAAALMFLFFFPIILLAVGPMIGAFAYLGISAKDAGAAAGKDPSGAALAAIGVSYMFIFAMIPVMYYLMGRMLLVFPLIVERGYGPMQAIKTSWNVTGPYQWWLMLLYLISQILGQVGIYLCGVGVLFTMPLSHAFTGAAIYMLLGEDDGSNRNAAATPPPATTFGGTEPTPPANPYS